ncbi:hypothetical protein OG230_07235 [Streptomyces sp. NBC_00234]|uniref:hypothetical protein n=1 Tax=Streptomyces sp. NBC_00234 TaxID=2903638 RepID=UPI002E2C89CF|nr:hypothetical protein [Streptomyces sp. NBC_00234]
MLGAGGCGGRATTHHKPGTGHEQAEGAVGRLLAAEDGTGHRLRQVDAADAPGLTLSARPDSEDGWNVHLSVSDFRFTPDSVGGAALPGRGHARLFVDGRPVARLYGPWYHLPAALVRGADGKGSLTAGLYADDHTAWAVDGKPIRATIPLTTGTTGTTGATGSPGTADRSVDIEVTEGAVRPAPGRTEVKKGDRIVLRVRSDRADTLHVHGYDKELRLPAGRTATLTLTADRTGLFEVETHESGLLLTQLVVR